MLQSFKTLKKKKREISTGKSSWLFPYIICQSDVALMYQNSGLL